MCWGNVNTPVLTRLRRHIILLFMVTSTKTTQLQIRISPMEKKAIQRAAKLANMDMSAYVLEKLLPVKVTQFQQLLDDLLQSDNVRFVLAEINTLLSRLNSSEVKQVCRVAVPVGLSEFLSNYVCAMVEYVCHIHHVAVPAWTKAIAPLKQAVFCTELDSLRLYLLSHSPPSFRCRNIFVDTTIGGQL